MITAELRRAILAAAGHDHDPLLRPGPAPGSYTSSLPFRLGPEPGQALAARLATEPWIATAEVTGSGYLTVTVTHEALATLAVRITRAGPACAASDALAGHTAPGPSRSDLTAAPDWPSARAALAAQLTARLAATAGATISFYAERSVVPPPVPGSPVPVAVAYAGLDAVRFALAATPPGAGRACSRHPRSWRCSTRCPGSRNGWPWPRAVAAPTSSPGTWPGWQRGRLTP
jgi:hypothetical protein